MEPLKPHLPTRLPTPSPRQRLRPNTAHGYWVMKAILNRLKEASSWAGIAVLGTFLGLDAEESNVIWQAITALAAVAAIFIPDAPKEKPTDG